jgi:hypothetical protein
MKLPRREKTINAVEPKLLYLKQMESFHEVKANKRYERDLYVLIKEMHTHMRETELSEGGGRIEDTRGRIREVQKEMCCIILLHAVGSTLCFVIPSSMCCNSNLFYVSYFKFVCNFFSQIHCQHNKF